MSLDLLPTRTASAAANMAADFLMLQHYPEPGHARWRHYRWHRPAVTFGYRQKLAEVASQLPADLAEAERCRRPTGGGIVDHRDDWTYALVIPATHDLAQVPAPQSYLAVHQVLATALVAQACPAELQTQPPTPPAPATAEAAGAAVCFTRAEPADVIHRVSRAKIAGAAQKRSKRGVLWQGSVARAVVGEMDWDRFEEDFTAGLAQLLQRPASPTPWPDNWDDAVDALTESYLLPEWNARR